MYDTYCIDAVIRRSCDNGLTWTETTLIPENNKDVMGNPCPIIQHIGNNAGRIHLMLTWNRSQDNDYC